MPNQSQPTNRSGAAHTPGPWAFAAYQYGKRPRWETIWGHSKHIATITQGYSAERDDCPDDKEAQANARLIASAPALLEALRNAVERMEAVAESIPVHNRHKGVSQAAHVAHMAGHLAQHAKIARAALAQAQGEVQP